MVDCKEFISVTGKNVFSNELEFIKKDTQAEYQYYEQGTDESEVIASTWNVRHLAKTGEHFYPKYL